MSERPKATSKGVFKALTEPIPPRPDIPLWEPVGPEGKGGYEWGLKPDGDMGFIPGGISTVFPFAHDVGGIVHVDSEDDLYRAKVSELMDRYDDDEAVDPPNE